jgi:hypothetical protein
MFHEPKAKNDEKYYIKSGIDKYVAMRKLVVLQPNRVWNKKSPTEAGLKIFIYGI